jgi:hypothetical protein
VLSIYPSKNWALIFEELNAFGSSETLALRRGIEVFNRDDLTGLWIADFVDHVLQAQGFGANLIGPRKITA